MAIPRKQWTQTLDHDPFCVYCGTTESPFEWDHVIPIARGGLDHPVNLVTACRDCNRKKRDSFPSEFMDHVPRLLMNLESVLLDELNGRVERSIPKIIMRP